MVSEEPTLPEEPAESSKLWQAMVWTLRITVALQCVGNWRWLAQIGESPLLSWMISPEDVGGMNWNEATGLAVQQATGWLALAAGVCVLLRPCAAVLGPLALLQLLIAVAMWRTGYGYPLQAAWLSPQLTAMFPLVTQSARMVAPLALLLLDPWRAERPLSPRRVRLAMGLLVGGAVLAFLSHGAEAWYRYPVFIDLLIGTSGRLFGVALSQSSAEAMLSIIGILDGFVAIACLFPRLRGMFWWMAFWGGVAALSRVTAFGWDWAWHSAAVRMPHLGVPLAVVLYWHLVRWKTPSRPPFPSKSRKMHSNISRRLSCLLVLVAILACGLPTSIANAKDAVLPEEGKPIQWRLIWLTDPATSATLSWSTTVPGKAHRVHLRESDGEKKTLVEAQRNGRYSGKSPELYYHHAHLTDLKPATQYHVIIESDGQQSPEMFFTTAPAEEVPVSILFGADSRSGHKERRQMNAMLASMVAESYQADRVPILALVHGGDFIQKGDRLDQWSRWMSDHELTVGPNGRLLPIIPARGNHDFGEPFNEVFSFLAEERTNYYALNLSPEIRLITLNTETSVAGDQTDWLESELKASRPKNRWLLAQYHKPAFPAVKVPWINLVHWVPLFEQYNVDLVCEGDGHNIKRTPPIRNMKIDPTGVVYIGEGGLGVGQRSPKTSRWYLQPPHAKTGSEHHVQLLTFDKEKLTYRVILLGGKLFDEHHLSARSQETRNQETGNPEAGEAGSQKSE